MQIRPDPLQLLQAAVLLGRQGLACGVSVLQVTLQALEAVGVPPRGVESPAQGGASPCTRAPACTRVPAWGVSREGTSGDVPGGRERPGPSSREIHHVAPHVYWFPRGVSSGAREVTPSGGGGLPVEFG